MSMLGDILLRHRFVSSDKIEVAMKRQKQFGGRLGSNLIDMGLAHPDTIARALGTLHGVPAAGEQAFLRMDPRVLRTVPRAFVELYGLFPLAVEGDTLHLAMRDPQDISLIDELASRLNYKLHAYATPEYRLLRFQQQHYKVSWPQRYLLTGPSGQTGPQPTTQSTAGPAGSRQTRPPNAPRTQPGFSAAQRPGGQPLDATGPMPRQATGTRPPVAPARPKSGAHSVRALEKASGVHPAISAIQTGTHGAIGSGSSPSIGATPPAAGGDEMELVYLDEVSLGGEPEEDDTFELEIDVDLDIDENAQIPQATEDQLSTAELIARLQNAKDRETVIGLLLQPIFDNTSLNVLLLPKGELASGLAAVGENIERDRVKQLVIPLNTPSLLSQALETKVVARGPADAFQQMIASFLQGPTPKEVCVTPVCLNDKVVNLVCTHCVESMPEGADTDLGQVATQAAAAFRRIILNRRKG